MKKRYKLKENVKEFLVILLGTCIFICLILCYCERVERIEIQQQIDEQLERNK